MAYPETDTIPKGALTYINNWYKDWKYNKKAPEVYSKYLVKGNEMENESLGLIADYLDLPFLKKSYTGYFNEYCTGSTDAETKDLIIDAKSCWTHRTFPCLKSEKLNKDYEWQMRGYLWLTGKSLAKVCYTLVETPDHLIEKEAYSFCKNEGIPYSEEVCEYYKELHSLKDIPIEDRVRVFDVERCEEKEEQIKK